MAKELPPGRLFLRLGALMAALGVSHQSSLPWAQALPLSGNPDFRSSCEKDSEVEALQNKVLYGYPEMEPCYKAALTECQLRATSDPQKKASLQVEENEYLAQAHDKRIGCSSQKKSPQLNILISRQFAGGLHSDRDGKHDTCVTGYIAINGSTVAYTLEKPYRGNESYISSIPAGKYDATLRFEGKNGPYPNEGYRVTLLNVPGGRGGIQIHIGNYPTEIEGCILVGTAVHPEACSLEASTVAYQRLKKAVRDQAEADADAAEKKITVTIRNTGVGN